jgi:hypothetical protein
MQQELGKKNTFRRVLSAVTDAAFICFRYIHWAVPGGRAV